VSIERLVGVYDADGTLRGELSYLVGRARGTAHCSLCDITHGRVRRRSDFDAACARLPVPLELHHRNEIDDTVRLAAGGRFPCIVGLGQEGGRVILDREDLEACAGDPTTLVERINAAI
jgi:hypothetical protein